MNVLKGLSSQNDINIEISKIIRVFVWEYTHHSCISSNELRESSTAQLSGLASGSGGLRLNKDVWDGSCGSAVHLSL